MKKFLDKYEICTRPASLQAHFDVAKREYKKHGEKIMDFEKYPVFTHMKDDIGRIRDELVKDSDNLIYSYFLYSAIHARDNEAIAALSAPRKSNESELYDTLPLFALLWELPVMVAEHATRHVPKDVTADTIEMFQNQMGDYLLLNGRLGISSYVSWMLKFLQCKILRVGRFNLEICKYNCAFDAFIRENEIKLMPNGVAFHRSGRVLGSVGCEDEDGSYVGNIRENNGCYVGLTVDGGVVLNQEQRLPISEWKRVLTKGDTVVSVHIPTGGALTPEICERDLRRGEEIILSSFANFKMFFCLSWLLDTELRVITGKEGNVTRFGDRFMRFPIKSNGNDVFEYVFETLPDTPLSELPEKNSFARAIKTHLLSGGHVYGAAGVFRKFESPDIAIIPRPMQLVIDDLGWFCGKDDRECGGPSRTGMPRRHCAEDIRAINRLGEAINMKINCAFIVGEWDPDNRLRDVPHLSKYGDGWDNAAYLDRTEMTRYVEAINESPYIDMALHGLLHGYYMDGVDNPDTSDYCYYIDKKFYWVNEAEVRTRVEKFFDILAYYGINKQVTSFVPPSFRYKLFGISGILHDYGIKYISTIFRTMEKEPDMPEIACAEGEVITVDRNINIYPWDAYDCAFDDLPPVRGILGTHWPNFLHIDPARHDEVIDRAIKYFKDSSENYGIVLSRGMEFCAIQSMYCRYAQTSIYGNGVTIDLRGVSRTPVFGKPFVISAKRKPKSCIGADIVTLEEKDGFTNYELTPKCDVVELIF